MVKLANITIKEEDRYKVTNDLYTDDMIRGTCMYMYMSYIYKRYMCTCGIVHVILLQWNPLYGHHWDQQTCPFNGGVFC